MPWVFIGCLAMALAVIAGAFGAHGLRARLSPEMLAVWETAVRYHVYHALALFVLDLVRLSHRDTWVRPPGAWQAAGWLFVTGLVFFSGSLYLLAVTEKRWLGAITPLGGTAWIVGWLCLAYAAWQGRGA